MDRPNWGKDPFTKFRKQRGNPQIGQPPGLIPKKGYPIFGLALLALHTPTVKSGRPAKQHIRCEGLALFLRTVTDASVCDTVRARPCAGDYTLIMGDGHREPFRSWAAERAEATCFDMSRFDAIPPSTRGGIDTADARQPGTPDGDTHPARSGLYPPGEWTVYTCVLPPSRITFRRCGSIRHRTQPLGR